MTEVFSEEIKNIFSIAKQLELTGEIELSKSLCLKCVKAVAFYNGTDVLTMFYGDGIYEKMRDEGDALNYVFIARCAMSAYDVVYSKNSAYAAAGSWAREDTSESNQLLKDFFVWLSRPNRSVSASDCKYFKKLTDAMSRPDEVRFKMSQNIVYRSFTEIIKMLVNGSAKITADGTLI